MRWLCCVLSFLAVARASKEEKDNHVIVIGGGLSGLAAALELQRFGGFLTTIVEASSRLGGRVSSLSQQGIELGGTYLHGNTNALSKLIQDTYKLPTVVSGGASAHPGKESAVWTFQGRELNKTWTEERSSVLYTSWLEGIQVALQNYTSMEERTTVQHLQETSNQIVDKLTRNSSLDHALLHFETTMAFEHDLGVPFSQVAVKGLFNNWDWVDHEGPDRVVREGFSTLIQAMKNDIQGEIFLNSPVKRISYHNGSCSVTLNSQDEQVLTSSACIVTIPLGVLKKHHKTLFDPPLPRPKQEALERAGVAAFNTLVLTWNTPLCRAGAYYPLHANNEKEENPLKNGFVCPQVLRSNAIESTVTQFYISGDEYPFHNEAYWKQQAVKVVNLVFSTQQYSQEDIVSFHITTWHQDAFILGAYSAPTTLTRGNADRLVLQQSLDHVVFFAGEHVNTCGRYQSLDGAYDTGIHAARQVAESRRAAQSFPQLQMTCKKDETTPAVELAR